MKTANEKLREIREFRVPIYKKDGKTLQRESDVMTKKLDKALQALDFKAASAVDLGNGVGYDHLVIVETLSPASEKQIAQIEKVVKTTLKISDLKLTDKVRNELWFGWDDKVLRGLTGYKQIGK